MDRNNLLTAFKAGAVSLAVICLLPACSKQYTDKLYRSDRKGQEVERINIAQPNNNKLRKDTTIVKQKIYSTYKDANGVEQTLVGSTYDEKTGEDISTFELGEIQVIAKSKQVAERNGKVALDFMVRVPGRYINDRWQTRLTPKVFFREDSLQLEKLLLTGKGFQHAQDQGISKYEDFINSIVPDDAYLENFFDESGYLNALKKIEDENFRKWKAEHVEWNEYVDYYNKINRRYLLYNGQMYKNREAAERTGAWHKWLPSHWLERQVTKRLVPKKWKQYFDKDYKMQLRAINARDSAALAKRYFDFKARDKNDQKKQMVDDMYGKLVRFPKQDARLDTIIKNGQYFEFYYKQDLEANDDYKKVFVTLEGDILASDESTYRLPNTDTLVYYISSVSQFCDTTIHYKDDIISKYQMANLTADIKFETGKSDFKPDLANNASELERVLENFRKITFSGELVVDSINMYATASPEGSFQMNKNLSQRRGESIKAYVKKSAEDDEAASLLFPKAKGEDWEMLEKLALENTGFQDKKAVIDIIRSKDQPDVKERALKALGHPDYDLLYDSIYPQLRAVRLEFYLHRRDMVQDTIHTTVVDDEYMSAVELIKKRNYKDALTILEKYNDYNTAVCLMSLGYDQRALGIMMDEEESANQQYLMAILYSRLNQDEKAVGCFMRSTVLDPGKVYRGRLDPEINRLIETYGLKFEDDEFDF